MRSASSKPSIEASMDIVITVVALPSHEDLLFDIAAALQRDFDGALGFRWLSPGEAMDLTLPSG